MRWRSVSSCEESRKVDSVDFTKVSRNKSARQPPASVKLSLGISVTACDLTTGPLVGLKLVVCGSTKGCSLAQRPVETSSTRELCTLLKKTWDDYSLQGKGSRWLQCQTQHEMRNERTDVVLICLMGPSDPVILFA